MMTSDKGQTQDYHVWKSADLAQNFLEGVRGAVPLAGEQIDVLLRLLRLTQPQVKMQSKQRLLLMRSSLVLPFIISPTTGK